MIKYLNYRYITTYHIHKTMEIGKNPMAQKLK